MENASKALLIAGSVLIVILLIGVGMLIFNSIDNITGQAGDQADAMAIQTFNDQFTQYESTNATASQTKGLINKVDASNVNSSNQVKLTGAITKTSQINNSHRYTIEITKHAATDCSCSNTETSEGYVCSIKITDNNA